MEINNLKNEQQCAIHDVSGSSIRIPKPCLKFEGLDNLSIVSENPIPLSDLFELHLKLENYLKTRFRLLSSGGDKCKTMFKLITKNNKYAK